MPSVFIHQSGIVSALGRGVESHWQKLASGESSVKSLENTRHALNFPGTFGQTPIAALHQEDIAGIEKLRENRALRIYDQAALAAVSVAFDCMKNIESSLADCHVICGSSRGATQSWEQHLEDFKNGKVKPYVSPATTPGSFASAVTHALGCGGGQSFLSSTCTTGLQVVGMAAALVKSDQAQEVLAVASEFSTTKFTLQQLDALSVYAKPAGPSFAYLPFHNERNGMVLGEGAAAIFLSAQKKNIQDIELVGYGAASEGTSATGLSKEGHAVAKAIRSALHSANISPNEVDVIVAHGSGTRMGDASELAGYEQVFGEHLPLLTAHKWSWGHALGASGLMSLVMAAEILNRQVVFGLPYIDLGKRRETLQYVLVTALGFGGHAVAILLKK